MITRGVALVGLAYLALVAGRAMVRKGQPIFSFPWEHPIGVYGLLTIIAGNAVGLVFAPREAHMGEVARILYVHVPAAWIGMMCFLVAPIFALAHLVSGKRRWDSLTEAVTEVGVVEGALLLVLGSIFARPTWGVWWSWDPRLTSSAVMTLSFVGVLLLRGVVREPERRATWSSIAAILAGVNVPIVYMSVKWWASIHQVQSGMGKTSAIAPEMRWIMFFNTWALLFATVWFIAQRVRLAEARADAEMPEPLPEAVV